MNRQILMDDEISILIDKTLSDGDNFNPEIDEYEMDPCSFLQAVEIVKTKIKLFSSDELKEFIKTINSELNSRNLKVYMYMHPTNSDSKIHFYINDGTLDTLCGIDTTEKLIGYESSKKSLTKKTIIEDIDLNNNLYCKKCVKKLKTMI